ncbi:NUDIX hydrolase [Polycladidibacter hongkongensis]|uniref:NUDIX hydrolase n=1 Tax=Polycladidibacter hongkongensis TaxID=1647556 RepID=UPI00082CE163|nr:NUDIX domain-containing protein [Pseudovibrio hongkongensis]
MTETIFHSGAVPQNGRFRPYVVSTACVSGGRVLLIERGKQPNKGKLAFPGGRIEAGESTKNAAQRELREETGIGADEFLPLGYFALGGDRALQVFVCYNFSGSARAMSDAAAVVWLPLAQAKQRRDLAPGMLPALHALTL